MRPAAMVLWACVLLGCSDDEASAVSGSVSGEGGAGGSGGGASVYRPATGTSWQWQLTGLPIDSSFDVEVYDVDLFETAAEDLATLHGDGRKIICYFSAGSWEAFRPDAADYPDELKGDPLSPPFEDERWLDVRSAKLRELVEARLDRAVDRGCDGVEPDNMDGYLNDTFFGLDAQDQLDFNAFVATAAHARGLSVGLKNDVEQLAALVDHFDWALNEECFACDECGEYEASFLAQDKAVFHVEYDDFPPRDAPCRAEPPVLADVCAVTQPLGLSTLLKHVDLDAFQQACPTD